ncbi:hypothetical protein ACJJTC_015929 [Scirpophaga incertulas]
MAEKSEDTNPNQASGSSRNDEKYSGNWWESWITSAKSKSAEVYTMVKKDLNEFGCAVKSEATHVFSATSSVIRKTLEMDMSEQPTNSMKKSFSSFIGQVSTVLSPEPDDEDDTEVILSSRDTTMLSTYKRELEALQQVDATFIVPADSPEFTAWRASIEDSDCVIRPTSAVKRLQSNPILKQQYLKLVPDAVSHEVFWERYLFRVALLQDRLAAASRKQLVEEPSTDPVLAHLPLQTPAKEQSPKKVLSDIEINELGYVARDVDQTISWEEEFANEVELTEEQQTLLLEEYEKEIASKKAPKKASINVTNNNEDKKNTQTRDNMNNKTPDKKKCSPKKGKADVCGNLVEDYFADKEVKDDASASSDESWEKDFEFDNIRP